jgi:Flp pilus assembly protein TadD
MQTRIYLVVFVLISALGAGAQQNSPQNSQQSLQQNPGAQALLQWLHQSNYDHGQYDGLYTATPQQLLQRVDKNTVRQLAVTSNALQRNPNNVDALVWRGYAALGAADESMYRDSWLHYAAQDFEKALRLDPNNFTARHNYAQTCFEVGDVSPAQPVMHLAVTHFTKAIALKPDSARSYMGRGWAYLMLKDDAHANVDFQKTLQLDPSLRPELEKEASSIREKLKQIAGAQQTLRAMGSYTVDPTARTAGQCAAKKGFWTNGECRFTDLGLHQGIAPPNSPGTGTWSTKGDGMVVR